MGGHVTSNCQTFKKIAPICWATFFVYLYVYCIQVIMILNFQFLISCCNSECFLLLISLYSRRVQVRGAGTKRSETTDRQTKYLLLPAGTIQICLARLRAAKTWQATKNTRRCGEVKEAMNMRSCNQQTKYITQLVTFKNDRHCTLISI